MAGEWPSLTVGELADSVSDTHKFAKDHLIFLNTSDVLLGKILHRTYSAVRDWPGQAKKSIRREDILFSEIRPANGRWAYVDVDADDYVVSTKLMVIRSRRSRVVPRFLYHFLTSSKTTRWLQHLAESRSGTFPQITFDQVAALELALPPLEAQTTIAAFLDCISDKIELNRRMNETLEAMARALFKSWFVDFDPVRAKAEGSDPGLPKPLADLFPTHLVDSELGEIPEGWEVGKLGDVICQRVERCVASAETAAQPYVPIDCISPRSLFLMESKPGDEAQSSLAKFHRGDLLFGAMRPYFHKVCIAPFDGTTRTTAFVLYPRQERDFAYATMLLHHPDTIDFVTRHSTGSTIPYAVWADSMEAMPAILPPSNVRTAFNHAVRPMLARISQPYFESRALAALRDALLPKLISGGLVPKGSQQY